VAYVFVLIFFAAVAGLIKPYIKGLKRSHFAIAAVVAFVLVGLTAPSTPGSKGKNDSGTARAAAADATDTNSASGTDDGDATTQPATNWDYQTRKDEMRGTSSKLAQVTSDNTVDLDFPYGEVHGQLWIRQRPEDGLNVAFEVEKGQILCNSFEESYISIKFDNGPIQKFRCTEASDGSDNVAFLGNEHRVLSDLEKSKRAIVEAEFYQQGRKQFTFETAGLNWK
jgi:hypothetical protein